MVHIIVAAAIALCSFVSCCQFAEAKSMRKVKVSLLHSECPAENLKAYIAYLRTELDNSWKPVTDSKNSVSIGFSLHPGGEFSNLRVEKTSRMSSSDQAALKSIEHCKFKEPPRCGDTIEFLAKFDYEP